MTVETQPNDIVNPDAVGPDKPYDDPAFKAVIERGTAEQIESWNHDWSIRINALMEALDLSRIEVMLYLVLCQVGTLRGLGVGFQAMFNGEPQSNRRAMEDQLLTMQLRIAAKELGLELVEEESLPQPTPEEAERHAKRGWSIR